MNIRTLRGVNIDSDHSLIGIWIKVKIKKQKKCYLTNIGRTEITKLTYIQIAEKYEECFQNIIKSKQIIMEDSVDKTWDHIKESISETAKKVLGKKIKGKPVV